jgi:hypothetical protein
MSKPMPILILRHPITDQSEAIAIASVCYTEKLLCNRINYLQAELDSAKNLFALNRLTMKSLEAKYAAPYS